MTHQHPLINLPVGLAVHEMVYDQAGHPVGFCFGEVNQAFEELAGLTAKELIGKSFEEVMPALEMAGFKAPDHYLAWMLRADGTPFECHATRLGKWFKVQRHGGENGLFTTIFTDITEYKETQESYQQKAVYFEAMVNNLPGVAYRCKIDDDWTMVYFSSEMDTISGYSAKELLYNQEVSYGKIIHENDQERVKQTVEMSLARDGTWGVECRIRRKDGSIRWVYDRGRAVYSPDGEMIYLDGFISDITDRKNAEEALEETRRILEQTSRMAQVGGWEKDFVKGTDEWSEVTRAIHEVDSDFVPTMENSIAFYKEGEHRERIIREVQHTIATGEPFDVELILVTAKGRERWVRAMGNARFEEGRCVGLYGVFQDIDARKKAEEQLRLKSAQYELAINGTSDGIYDWDFATGEVFLSKRWKALVGYEDHELDNTLETVESLVYEVDLPQVRAYLDRYLQGEEAQYAIEYRMKHKDGTLRWILARGEALRGEDGKPYRMAGSYTDITDRRQAEEDLKESLKRYNELVAKVPVGIYIVWIRANTEIDFEYVSDRWCEINQLSRELVMEDPSVPFSLIHPDEQAAFLEANMHAHKTLNSFFWEGRAFTAKGELRWFRIQSTPVKFENGDSRWFGMMQDITLLKNNEFKFKGIFNSTFSFIWFLSTDGILLEANDTALKMAGLQPENVIGKYFWDCYWWQISEETQKELQGNIQKAAAGEEVVYEVNIWIANQKPITILFSLKPLFDEHGHVTFIIPEGRPIQEIIDARNRNKSIIEGTNVGTWEWNVQTGETVFNKRWANMIGYTLEEILPTTIETWNRFVHPDDWQKSNALLERHFAGELDYYECESRMLHKNGRWVWVLDRGRVATWTPEGKPILMMGTHQDITQRKERELQIAYQKNILDALFELSPIGIALTDFETGRFIDVNPKLLEPTGYTKEEFLKLNFGDITPKEYAAAELEVIRQIEEEGVVGYFEKEYIRKDGSRYPVVIRGALTKDLHGKKLIWAFVQDVSKEKALEQRLIHSKEQAEAANKAKSEFLANMSHEIRTPLNGVIGFTDLLLTTCLNETQQEYCKNINTSGKALLGIISDILDFSKIEAGKLDLELVETDIVAVAEQAVDIIKYQADNKGLELLLDIQPGMPRHIVADPVRLKQILVNLLSNAVKFTQKGEVALVLRFIPLQKGNGEFRFAVCDTGIGITEAQQQKIFQAFTQADSSTTRKFGGTGLGLVISSLLTEKMGGKIGVQSEWGKGSTFSFSITTTYQPQIGPGQMCPEKLKVLAVDDNAAALEIMGNYCREWGNYFQGCTDAISALKLLEIQQFDLLIVDYHMPFLDGLDIMRIVREKLGLSQEHLPAILLYSTSDDQQVLDNCSKLGMAMLVKPVKADELYQLICNFHETQSVSDQGKGRSITSKETQPINANSPVILMAEDVPMNMVLVKAMLNNLLPEAHFIEAYNGQEALEMMKTCKIDLVLMDVHMPVMDGLAATRLMRKWEASQEHTVKIPIVALTAGALKEEQQKALEAGMDEFLTKPIEQDKLQDCLLKYLQHKQPAVRALEQVTDPEIHFDFDDLTKGIGGNEKQAREILALGFAAVPREMARLAQAIAKQDRQQVKALAHAIRGILLGIRCGKMTQGMLELENLASEGSFRQWEELFLTLQEEWTSVVPLIMARL